MLLLMGSGVVAAAQIGKAIIAVPMIRGGLAATVPPEDMCPPSAPPCEHAATHNPVIGIGPTEVQEFGTSTGPAAPCAASA
ncbi:hypothetical protein [Bradyrhizobium sp. 170]|uniref:hypothetical protein n=1 Tax=Bradyrhizobium sp. 170 TaxID=2782641 RepID=UPI001FFF14D5|nr:hypothetical protein [Bradyrhizobium sp. 170]UPK05462.1 hypothetical protein IVB05_07135 [Bradyrhizobium sp. 170]